MAPACARLAAVYHQLAPPPQPTAAPAAGGGALALVSRNLQPSDLMFGGAPIGGVPFEQAEATVHACLRAGIRHYDSAPLYSESEDKLGAALLSASEDTIGAPCSFANGQLVVDGEPVYIYTKTGRLIRHRIETDADELAWRPAGPAHGPTMAQWPEPGAPRMVTDDFSANGAFLSFAESRQRLGGGLAIDTLRIHDADTVGGPGTSQATGALDQALLPQGMLAGLRALRKDGQIQKVSLGMNSHRQHRAPHSEDGLWTPEVITDFIEAAPPGTFDSALLAYGWNLISQDAMEVMAVCAEHGVAVHLAGIFGGGQYPLFAPKPEHAEKVQQWEDLAAKHGVSLAAVAITFGSLPTAVDKVIMGVRSQEELEMNIEAMAEKVPAELFREAQAQGLLRSELQLP